MKAVIIAAGNSSRLWPETNKTPKTLLPFGSGTILSTIMQNIARAGIRDFVFILGFKAEQIQGYLEQNNSFGFNTTIILNEEYQRGNGISVLLAEQAVNNTEFILSMSDHLVPARAIERVINDDRDKNLLLVDKKTNKIFDIDDATKVWLNDTRITKINKNLTTYNSIDCGIFRLTGRFFDAMRKQEKNGKESISAGVEILIENNDMDAVFLNDSEKWIDIDTPAAYQHSLKHFSFSTSTGFTNGRQLND